MEDELRTLFVDPAAYEAQHKACLTGDHDVCVRFKQLGVPCSSDMAPAATHRVRCGHYQKACFVQPLLAIAQVEHA